MKKRLKYKRVVLIGSIIFIVLLIVTYMIFQIKREYVYEGTIKTYSATYQQNEKVYTFELKTFIKDNITYICVNDIYNVMSVMDNQTRAYVDYQTSKMTIEQGDKTYIFDYGHDKIVYNNKCIEFDNKKEHIYVSSKKVYISFFQTEKLLLKNEKKIKFANKNAIIS